MVFNPGDGLWVAGKDGLNLVFPGEVNFTDVAMGLRTGFMPTGNMMAIAKDLTTLSVSGYDPEEGAEGDVCIQVLGAYGNTLAKYYWYDIDDNGDVLKGWLDANDEPVESGAVSFSAGDGMWVAGKDGLTLNVKAPTLK